MSAEPRLQQLLPREQYRRKDSSRMPGCKENHAHELPKGSVPRWHMHSSSEWTLRQQVSRIRGDILGDTNRQGIQSRARETLESGHSRREPCPSRYASIGVQTMKACILADHVQGLLLAGKRYRGSADENVSVSSELPDIVMLHASLRIMPNSDLEIVPC